MFLRKFTPYVLPKHVFLSKRSFFATKWSLSLYKPITPVDSTIFSLSSGTSKSAIAIVRLSGSKTSNVIESMTNGNIPTPRMASLRDILHPKTKEKLDQGLLLYFPAPNSFTGEDMLEFHIHGARAVVQGILGGLSEVEGLRLAEPGEFAKRAFYNGKLDLTEIEGLADLVNSETEAQRKQALRQLSGELSSLYNQWRSDLIKSLAYVEALIDFGEDAEISDEMSKTVSEQVDGLRSSILAHLDDSRRGERLREGAHIIIVGPPNVGKSSLLNLLAKRKAAIVSNIPGTTRDIVDVPLNIAGYPIVLSDTAGIRMSTDVIEQEGISRAKERFSQADVKLCMFDATTDVASIDTNLLKLIDKDTIILLNKQDLTQSNNISQLAKYFKEKGHNHVLAMSCTSGQGTQDLLKSLEAQLKNMFETGQADTTTPLITRTRYRNHLQECVEHLDQFLHKLHTTQDIAIVTEELRYAIRSIGAITGAVDVEELLDVIFSDFCIGK